MSNKRRRVCFTVDVEQDCPPFLDTSRGISVGLPLLLALLSEEEITGTFFITGRIAREHPYAVESILRRGHTLGCHGDSHRSFRRLSRPEAETELDRSTRVLRTFGELRAFRAPYLDLPEEDLSLLVDHGLTWDSSLARYKPAHWAELGRHREIPGLRRIPVSLTSSVLRLPASLLRGLLQRPPDPLVLFVHPWEYVDWGSSHLRWDCRFNTGPQALERLQWILERLRSQSVDFLPLTSL